MHTHKRIYFYVGMFTVMVGTVITVILFSSKTKESHLLEYAKQKIEERREPNIGVFDPLLGWSHRANAAGRSVTSGFNVLYTINSRCLRDKEISLGKTAGTYRIVALGESNLFGEGVVYGKRFSEVIEDAFEGVEVVNMGIRGFGFDQSLLFLERDGFAYQPDLAIVFFSIQDYLERCKDFITAGEFKPRFVLAADKNSLVFNEVENNRQQFGNTEVAKIWPSLVKNLGRNGGEKDDRVFWTAINKYQALNRKLRGGYSNGDFKRLIYLLLKRFKADCSAHSVLCSVVVIDKCIPDYMVEFCRELGIPCLDIREALTRESNFHSLRFAIDPHYNELAHRMIGEYTSKFLGNHYPIKQNKVFRYCYLGKWQ